MNKTNPICSRDRKLEVLNSICQKLQNKTNDNATCLDDKCYRQEQTESRIKGLKTAIRVLENLSKNR